MYARSFSPQYIFIVVSCRVCSFGLAIFVDVCCMWTFSHLLVVYYMCDVYVCEHASLGRIILNLRVSHHSTDSLSAPHAGGWVSMEVLGHDHLRCHGHHWLHGVLV